MFAAQRKTLWRCLLFALQFTWDSSHKFTVSRWRKLIEYLNISHYDKPVGFGSQSAVNDSSNRRVFSTMSWTFMSFILCRDKVSWSLENRYDKQLLLIPKWLRRKLLIEADRCRRRSAQIPLHKLRSLCMSTPDALIVDWRLSYWSFFNARLTDKTKEETWRDLKWRKRERIVQNENFFRGLWRK